MEDVLDVYARPYDETDMLKREVAAWQMRRNQDTKPIDWQFTTANARVKLKRLYPILKTEEDRKSS